MRLNKTRLNALYKHANVLAKSCLKKKERVQMCFLLKFFFMGVPIHKCSKHCLERSIYIADRASV